MKKHKTILVVDGNNMLYRAYYKFSAMKSTDGIPTGISYGFPFILQSLISKLKPFKVVVVFDGNRHERRLELLPGYKQREKKESFNRDDFFRQVSIVKSMLDCLCIPHIKFDSMEADDVIWLITRKLTRKGYNITIASADKDFIQLIDDDVNVWEPKVGILINKENCEGIKGYKPYQCVDYLTLLGDTSDNIPGYPGVGEVTALKFLKEHDSISKFLAADKTQARIDNSKLTEIYARNRELIDIKLFCKRYVKNVIPKNLLKPKNREMDLQELTYLCADNSIKSFLKKPFIKTFQNLIVK